RGAPQDLVKHYGMASYLAGAWGRAEEVARWAREDGIVEPALIQIQAEIYFALGALDECEEVLRFWLKRNPEKRERVAILAHLAEVLVRGRQEREAQELLSGVRPQEITDSQLLFRLAAISRTCASDRGPQFAYWGWRRGQGNPSAE